MVGRFVQDNNDQWYFIPLNLYSKFCKANVPENEEFDYEFEQYACDSPDSYVLKVVDEL